MLWALTGRGYFWPEWTLIALGLPLAVHAWVVLVDDRPEVARALRLSRELAMHAGLSAAFAIFFVLVWAVTGAGYFWRSFVSHRPRRTIGACLPSSPTCARTASSTDVAAPSELSVRPCGV